MRCSLSFTVTLRREAWQGRLIAGCLHSPLTYPRGFDILIRVSRGCQMQFDHLNWRALVGVLGGAAVVLARALHTRSSRLSRLLPHRNSNRPLTKPTTGIAGCSARAASGHAAAPPTSVMNSRRFLSNMRLPSLR